MIKSNYKGISQLKDIKTLRSKLKYIEQLLLGRGCYNIQLSINYFYAYGFFTSPSGQVYYISTPDERFNNLNQDILIRQAANYKDYQGGINRYCKPTKEAILSFYLS
jgi:hypothetical protein